MDAAVTEDDQFWSIKSASSAKPRRIRSMSVLTNFVLKTRERLVRKAKGQTMTEYALILAAVAIVVFITYEVMGQDISTLVNRIDTALTTS
jgi:Flp pilus assembly pilin Flp